MNIMVHRNGKILRGKAFITGESVRRVVYEDSDGNEYVAFGKYNQADPRALVSIRWFRVHVLGLTEVPAEGAKANTSIRDWYMSAYPADECGEYINKDVTFYDLFEALDNYRDVYECIGFGDSIVRERCFTELSHVMGVDYNYIYDQWMRSC